jgi:hypothetical protein
MHDAAVAYVECAVVHESVDDLVEAAREQQRRIAEFNAARKAEEGLTSPPEMRDRLNALAATWPD